MGVNFAGYQQRTNTENQQYGAKSAAGDYGRFVAQQRGSRQVGDMARQFQTGYPKLAASWGQRGARPGINSGFYQQAMQQYLGDQQRQQSYLSQDLANEQNQFGLTQASLDAQHQSALSDIDFQKQQEIAALAQNISAVRAGGF